jgi:ribosomal protein S18 acetylase RimI-like enzyme
MSEAAEPALRLRPLVPTDQATLWELLHVALWDPPPAPPRPREVLDLPEVRIYAEHWGGPDDVGVVGENAAGGAVVGAAWMRLIAGRGLAYVDPRTPQLGIALFAPFRRRGYGERLLRAALAAGRAHGFPQVALTVHPQNPAIALYERCGFRKTEVRRTYHLMVKPLGEES